MTIKADGFARSCCQHLRNGFAIVMMVDRQESQPSDHGCIADRSSKVDKSADLSVEPWVHDLRQRSEPGRCRIWLSYRGQHLNRVLPTVRRGANRLFGLELWRGGQTVAHNLRVPPMMTACGRKQNRGAGVGLDPTPLFGHVG